VSGTESCSVRTFENPDSKLHYMGVGHAPHPQPPGSQDLGSLNSTIPEKPCLWDGCAGGGGRVQN
jgi:hypothetical protein